MRIGVFWSIVVAVAVLASAGAALGAEELVSVGDDWRYFKGTVAPSEPADAWQEKDFNDADWLVGASGFGYGDGDDTTILDDMEDNYRAVYIRKEFEVVSFDAGDEIELVVDYDDGFVAYLNGREIDRRNMPEGEVTFETNASSHEAGTPVVIAMGLAGDWLEVGRNVLAIEGHNTSLGSTDFSLIPMLRTVPGPVITEITEDTTWSGAYLNEGTVIVRDGATLTIEAGTVVSMVDRGSIVVEGRLLANGTAEEKIYFTRQGVGVRWKQIMFSDADDSVLRHCVIEFADCEGEHKKYYPDWEQDECDPNRVPPSRDYTEAVVAVACHVDMESCLFQNLPDDGGLGEGDAIAIISDDPDVPGESTANIRDCQFISIGQGVHTRYSHVVVEGCYFTGHHGDNDDVDLYGESTPPPLIINNILVNPGHDDMINPTRCSAIIIGNIIGGCDDHGVVLRDRCYPIMINNVIFNCNSAGVAVQNQCDALLINNTIVDCGRGVRFFDHTGRWGPEYCLYPGSGKATVVNCIIWDCSTTFELENSPWEGDPGSHVTIRYCDVQDGQGRLSVSSNSTVTWGEGNIDVDPQFADEAGGDYRLRSQYGRWDPELGEWVKDAVTSACIDAGVSGLADNPYIESPIAYGWAGELWPNGHATNLGTYGGTAQASMSASSAGSASDVDGDDMTGWSDVAVLVQKWLSEHAPQLADVNRDGVVDFLDLSLMGLDWGQTHE